VIINIVIIWPSTFPFPYDVICYWQQFLKLGNRFKNNPENNEFLGKINELFVN